MSKWAYDSAQPASFGSKQFCPIMACLCGYSLGTDPDTCWLTGSLFFLIGLSKPNSGTDNQSSCANCSHNLLKRLWIICGIKRNSCNSHRDPWLGSTRLPEMRRNMIRMSETSCLQKEHRSWPAVFRAQMLTIGQSLRAGWIVTQQ